jgi:thioredoxin 1
LTKKLVIVAAAVFIFAIAFVLKESQKRSSAPDSVSSGLSAPAQVEAEDKALPRLVDLGSDKCIPCKKMAPILAELSEEYRGALVVEVIDVRRNPEAGRQYAIRVIPTQVFVDASGEERFRHEGFMGRQAILDKWKELGVELTRKTSGAER